MKKVQIGDFIIGAAIMEDYRYKSPYAKPDRRIVNTNIDMLVLMDNSINDEKVNEIRGETKIFRIRKIIQGKNEQFATAIPVKDVSEEGISEKFRLFLTGSELKYGNSVEFSRYLYNLKKLYHLDNWDDIVSAIIKDVFDGESLSSIYEKANQNINIDIGAHQWVPTCTIYPNMYVHHSFHLKCVDDPDIPNIFISSYELEKYESILPSYLRFEIAEDLVVVRDDSGKDIVAHSFKLWIDMDQIQTITPDDNFAEKFNRGLISNWLLYPYQSKDSNSCVDYIFGREEPFEDKLLKLFGYKKISVPGFFPKTNNRIVPKNDTDWTVEFSTLNSYLPNKMIEVNFNGKSFGLFPVVWMFKKYPGKCLNAELKVSGNSIETMNISVIPKRNN